MRVVRRVRRRNSRRSQPLPTAPKQAVADTLWTALALVMIIEGLLPLLAPRVWRETFRRMLELTDGQLRFIGLAAIVLGAVGYALLQYA